MVQNENIAAMKSMEMALSLAQSSKDITQQCSVWQSISRIKWNLGDYSAAKMSAQESQKLGKLSANLYQEARGLRAEAMCSNATGNYKKSIALCTKALKLLDLCGMSGGDTYYALVNVLAVTYMDKSEYAAARSLHIEIAQGTSPTESPENHASALSNIAEIDVMIGMNRNDVHQNLERAQAIFKTIKYAPGQMGCDTTLADLDLRDGNNITAKAFFLECFHSAWGEDSNIVTHCLEKLGDPKCWNPRDIGWIFPWTVIFLCHGLKLQNKLAINKALRCLGDIFLVLGDKNTATTLFTIALEGFTHMDVHRGRGDCMLRLGDIAEEQGDLHRAVGFWMSARPLFEVSSQSKDVAYLDTKHTA
jgi:tetratricopeptide (TPR) repeat protein